MRHRLRLQSTQGREGSSAKRVNTKIQKSQEKNNQMERSRCNATSLQEVGVFPCWGSFLSEAFLVNYLTTQLALRPQLFPYHAGNDREFPITAAGHRLLPSFSLSEFSHRLEDWILLLPLSLTLSLQGRQTEAHLGLNTTAAGASICICINRGKNPQQLNYTQRHPAY